MSNRLIVKFMVTSIMLINGAICAHAGENSKTNLSLNNSLLTDNKTISQKGINYFKEVLKKDELYSFLRTMNTEVHDVAKTVEYVALFHELNLNNHILSQILKELKKNNKLLTQGNLNEGIAMDG